MGGWMEGKCQRMKKMSLLKFFPLGLVAMAEIIGWLAVHITTIKHDLLGKM
jgi:hypothetical protein